MSEAVDPRFAPPVAHVEDVAAAANGEAELASRWMRFSGSILDGVIVGGAYLALSQLPIVASFASRIDGAPGQMWAPHVGTVLIGLTLFLLLNGWLLFTRGQSIGKVACRTRIVRVDGSPASPGRLLLRQSLGHLSAIFLGLSMIYSLIDCLSIFRESRRCVHDSIAGTKVIKV